MGVTSTNLGRVGLLPKGEYNAETSYVRLDIVTYEGSAYVALQDVSGVTPGTDPANWQLLAARGEIGPQGNEGQRGEQGERGNGIVSVTFNPEDYTLTIQTDDGDDYTSPSLRGEKGETGEPGKDGDTGPQGEQGEQGEQGNGISSVKLNDDFTLTITLDDGQEFTTSSIRGETGPQGPANIVKGSAFESLEALQAGVQDPAEGDQYNVGTEAPYNVYRWTGESWEDQGKTQGPEGPEGKQGEPGTVFVPSLADDGTLSWTNEGGLDNPPDVNIKGPQGDPGKDGEPGKAGDTGPQGEPGKAPRIGEDGTWETWDEESGDWKTTGIKAVPVTLEVTVPADGWSSGNTFSVEVQSEAIHAQDVHVAEIKQIDNEETDKPVRESWAQVTHIDAEEGKLTFHAVKEPTAEMPVEIITWTGLPGQAGISKSNVFIVRRGTVGGAAPVNSIENAEVKLVENHYVYDGQEKTQEVESVTMNGEPLTLGTDYFVVNKTATTAGTHTLEVLGIRNYSGVKPVEWSIAKAQSTISVEPNSFSYSGDIGTVKTATISHFGEGEITADSNLPEVATATVEGSSLKVTCHKAGEAKITVKIADTINYEGASCDVDVSGVQLEGSLELDNQDLTVKGVMGTTGSVHFSHTGDGVVTAESQDSGTATARVEGDNIIVTSVKAGSTSITVTLPETPNYKGASAELSVIVEKADGSITLNSESLTVKGVMGTEGTVQFSHTGDGAITVESQTPTIATARYEGNTITVTSVKEGSATVDVSIAETENYTGASKTLSVQVQRATGSISVTPQSVDLTGDQGTQATANLEITGDGEVSISTSAYVQVNREGNRLTVTSVSEGSDTLTITLAETENYTGASCTLGVVVKFKPPVDDTFANNDWDAILAAAASGEIPATWKIGDTKPGLWFGEMQDLQIIGKNHDDLDPSDEHYNDPSYNKGTNKAALTILPVNQHSTAYRMNSTNTNATSWKDSEMRTETIPTLDALTDPAIRAVMRTVTKCTGQSYNDSTIVKTADKVFLLSHIEIFESVGSSQPGEGTQYEYFAAGNSKVKTRDGSASIWWTRSPSTNGSSYFRSVSSSGATNYNGASITRGVVAGFCI